MPEADMVQAILEVEGVSYLLASGVFSGFAEAITSGKIGQEGASSIILNQVLSRM